MQLPYTVTNVWRAIHVWELFTCETSHQSEILHSLIFFLLVTIESMLFLAMQVRVMAACMESQIDKQEYTASAQSRARDGTGGINQPSDVCENFTFRSSSLFILVPNLWIRIN